jgi:hypothetical protein
MHPVRLVMSIYFITFSSTRRSRVFNTHFTPNIAPREEVATLGKNFPRNSGNPPSPM